MYPTNLPQKAKKLQLKTLSKSNVVVTGGSRDIGGGIVLELAKAGAKVAAVFRKHEQRAQKIAIDAKTFGQELILTQADITTPVGLETVFTSWGEKFGNYIDVLVLCASGATMEINVDANMALVDKFLSLRKTRLKRGEELSLGTIIFLQSEPGHYHRVIDGAFDFLEYYRSKVGPAKRAGEDALLKRLTGMFDANVRAVIVCPPEVTDTFNMKLFEMQDTRAREKSRQFSTMIGTKAYVTIAEVAKAVKQILDSEDWRNGDIKLFGNVTDGLIYLGRIYGNEAVYVHTYEKLGDNSGIGRLVANPHLWQRDTEPSFTGEIKSHTANLFTTSLLVTKEHMRGHFRPEIASVFPGHKSIRTASISLGRFLNLDEKRVQLRKYKSVKFLSPVLPDQTLTTKVTLTDKTEDLAVGDAIQFTIDKETMQIHGMVVERIRDNEANSLILDQLVEAAAQTIGMHVLVSLKNEQMLPLFHSTGEATIFKNTQPGNNLLIKAENIKIIQRGTMNIFSADVEIKHAFIDFEEVNGEKAAKVVKEELVATIMGLQGLLLPKEEVLKKLS